MTVAHVVPTPGRSRILRQTHRQTDRPTDRQTDSDRPTDRPTDKQTNRQANQKSGRESEGREQRGATNYDPAEERALIQCAYNVNYHCCRHVDHARVHQSPMPGYQYPKIWAVSALFTLGLASTILSKTGHGTLRYVRSAFFTDRSTWSRVCASDAKLALLRWPSDCAVDSGYS